MMQNLPRTLSSFLDNIANTPEIIKALREEDVLLVLYKNGINLNPTEALVLSDIVKGTKSTFMANSIDDLRKKWEFLCKTVE